MRPSFRLVACFAFLLAAVAGCGDSDNTKFRSSVSVDRTTGLAANGLDGANFTVTVTRDDKPFQSREVFFITSGSGVIAPTSATTDTSGTARGKVSATAPGQKTVSFRLDDGTVVGETVTLTFVADAGAPGKEVQTFNTSTNPSGIATGDFTGDGRPDLAATALSAGAVTVQKGTAGSTFTGGGNFLAGPSPADVAAGDVDGDKLIDLVVAEQGAGGVLVLLGDGAGGFAKGPTFTAAGVKGVAALDITGEGRADMAVTDALGDTVSVWLGTTAGTPTALATLPTGDEPVAVAFAKLDDDAFADLVVANRGDDTVTVFLGAAGPTFTAGTTFATGDAPVALATGDLDGDGDTDIVVANSLDGTLSVLVNDGAGNFSPAPAIPTGPAPVGVAVGDLDGDGRADIAVSSAGAQEVEVFLQAASPGTAGTFVLPPLFYGLEAAPGAITLVPAGIDSLNRVAVVLPSAAKIAVIVPGASRVTASPLVVAADGTSTTTITVTLRDLNGNPIAGAAVTLTASGTGNIFVQPGPTNASGTATGTLATTVPGLRVVTASADTGGGVFADLDMHPRVIFGHLPATKLAFSVQPSAVTVNASITPAVVVTAQDGIGNVDTDFSGDITIAIDTNAGGGTLSGTLTVSATAGVASFGDLSIDALGAGYTLEATSGTLTAATSDPFDVIPGPAAELVFTTQPTPTTAGQSIAAVTVTARDAFGNTATSYAGTVTISIANNAGGGTLSGTSSTAAVAGVASFPGLSIDRSGDGYTLSASGTGGVSATTSAAFDIAPGAATQLAFTVGPVDTPAGASITPAVQVSAEDALGNVDTSFTGQVAIAIGSNPSGGALSGTTPVNAIGGVATFSDLSINLVGNGYTLVATATALADATSAPFGIGAGAAVTISFTAQPSDATAGQAIAPAIVVTAFDAQGNLATGFGGTINLAIGTNPGGGVITAGASASASSGTATFAGVTIDKAGSGYTLTASGVGSGATSATFSITTGTATQLLFLQQPTGTIAGAPITPDVTVRIADAFGNTVVTTTAVGIALGSNPGGGTLANASSQAAVNGVAQFESLSIDRSGDGYTLVATATALASATSAAFDIAPGPASSIAFTTQPSTATAGVAIAPAIVVTARDLLGNVAAGYTNTVTLSIATNPGGGTITAGATASAVSGVATFADVRIDRAGDGYTLLATGAGSFALGSNSATSDAFAITTGTATRLLFVQQPTTTTAGVAITPAPSVRVADGQGNTVVTTTAITLAIGTNPGAGTLSGTPTSTAVDGVAAFPGLSIDRAGDGYTLVASATGLTGATSGGFTISAGALAEVVFATQPSTATAGVAIAPAVVVVARDALHNTVTALVADVALTIAADPAGETLSGTTVTALSSGAATFGDLRIDRAGTGYTLAATVVSTPVSATSVAFDVVTGTASQLLFVQQPASTTAGAEIAPPVTVRIADAQGNTVPTDTAVTLTIGTDPSAGAATLAGGAATAASAGVATFAHLSIETAGAGYTLHATATAIAGDSAPFSITPDVPDHLAFAAQPGTTAVGATLAAVVVAVRDQFGNAAAFGDQIQLTLNPPAGNLGGTTLETAVSGAATFDDLTVSVLGTYTLVATGASLDPVSSDSFDVVAGPPALLAFTGQPGDADQGTPISVQVEVRDAGGNVTSGASVSVTLSIASGANPGGASLTGQLTRTSAGGLVTFDGVGVDRPGLGYRLAATLGSPQGTTTSASFDVFPQDVRVEDFSINSARVALGAATTTAWAFAGDPSVPPDFVTLTAGLSATTTAAASQQGTTPAGTLLVTPFPSSAAALVASDPRAFVEVRGSTVTLTGRVAEFSSAQACGGTGEDWAYAIAAARDGGTFLGGYVPGGTTHFGATPTSTASRSAYVARFPAGSPDAAWVFTARACTFRGVAALADGSAAAVGTVDASGSGLGSLDVGGVVLRLDGASGALLWAQGITGTAIQGVAASLDGGLFVAGGANSTGDFLFGAGLFATTLHLQAGEGFVARYDVGGNLLWATTQSGRSGAGSAAVAALPDGGAAVTSTTSGKVHVARHAADGAVLWVVTATSGAVLDIGGVVGLPDGGCAFTGRASGATFGAATGVTGAYVARVSPLGQIVQVSACGDGNTRSFGIAAFADDGLAILGQFSGTIGFGPSSAPPLAISAGGLDAFVVRFEPDGTLGWAKPFGGPGNEEPHAIAALPGGSVAVAGLIDAAGATFGVEQRSPVQITSHGDFDIFVARLDPVNYRTLEVKPGGFALARPTPSSQSEVRGTAVFPDGSFAITGFFVGSLTLGEGEPGQVTLTSVSGSLDIFVARYNANATLAWARGIGSTSGNEVGQDVAPLLDGSLVVTGGISGAADFGGTILPSAGIFVARYDRAGQLVYAKHGSNGSGIGFGVGVFPDGGVVVGGQYGNSATFGAGESAGPDQAGQTTITTNSGSTNGFIARYNADGTLRWLRNVTSNAGDSSAVRGVGAFADGSCAVGGGFTGGATFPDSRALTSLGGLDWYVIRFDEDGNASWVRRAGGQGSDQGNTFTTMADGSSVMAGSLVDTSTTVIELDGTFATTSFLGGSSNFRDNITLLRYDANGTFVTVTAAPVNGGQGFANGVVPLPDGSLALTGVFQGTATFGPGNVLTSQGVPHDAFVACYAPNGTVRFAKKGGGAGTDQGRGIDAAPDGSVIFGGSFASPAVFGAGEPNQATITSGGTTNGFFAKYYPYGD